MIEWTPNPRTAKLLRNVCVGGWLLCLATATRFVGAPDFTKPGLEMLLSVGIFPFFFGAVVILQKRMRGSPTRNWAPILFRGLPEQFRLFFQTFFFAVWLICLYLVLRQGLQKSEWPNFGISVQISFVLIPSVFYLASAGAYWSAAIEGEEK